MRIVGIVAGALLLAIGLVSFVLTVVMVYEVENSGGDLFVTCTDTSGALSCNGSSGSDAKFDALAWVLLFGSASVAGVVGGATLLGAGIVASGRKTPPAPGPVGPPAPPSR